MVDFTIGKSPIRSKYMNYNNSSNYNNTTGTDTQFE